MTNRWPWPGDTPLDRARRVAASYREALYRHFPDDAMDLDEKFVEWGEIWVAPQLDADVNFEEYVTIDVAAQYVGLSAKAVYAWVYRKTIDGQKGNDERLRVKLGDVLEESRRLRRKRAAKNPQRHAGAA